VMVEEGVDLGVEYDDDVWSTCVGQGELAGLREGFASDGCRVGDLVGSLEVSGSGISRWASAKRNCMDIWGQRIWSFCSQQQLDLIEEHSIYVSLGLHRLEMHNLSRPGLQA